MRQVTRSESPSLNGLRRNWTLKIEYLCMDLGTFSNSTTLIAGPGGIGARLNSRMTDNILRAASTIASSSADCC
jgi:hypothetical protein